MDEQEINCPIWGTQAIQLARSSDGGAKVRSPRTGGDYRISGSVRETIRHAKPAEKAKITTWIVDQRRSGEDAPLVTSYVFEQVQSRRQMRLSERKQRFFLLALSRGFQLTSSFKIAGTVDDRYRQDFGAIAAWTESWNDRQVASILRFLAEEGLVVQPAGSTVLTLTGKGFEHMEALESGVAPSTQAFVAMWFDQSMNASFDDGFYPAIDDAGYKAFRIDQKEHNNKIDDEIIAEIRRSRFVVADFTCGTVNVDGSALAIARGGVYYEAGFAQGLGLPVIWTCRSDCINHVHFDTRQFNHIVWTDPADLKVKLLNRIRAVIV